MLFTGLVLCIVEMMDTGCSRVQFWTHDTIGPRPIGRYGATAALSLHTGAPELAAGGRWRRTDTKSCGNGVVNPGKGRYQLSRTLEAGPLDCQSANGSGNGKTRQKRRCLQAGPVRVDITKAVTDLMGRRNRGRASNPGFGFRAENLIPNAACRSWAGAAMLIVEYSESTVTLKSSILTIHSVPAKC
jgi:hypothetical protein